MECRYYFENNKLIKSKFIGEPRCSNIPSDSDAKELLADCKKYLTKLSK
jgi:hypothetical protein